MFRSSGMFRNVLDPRLVQGFLRRRLHFSVAPSFSAVDFSAVRPPGCPEPKKTGLLSRVAYIVVFSPSLSEVKTHLSMNHVLFSPLLIKSPLCSVHVRSHWSSRSRPLRGRRAGPAPHDAFDESAQEERQVCRNWLSARCSS